MIKIIRNNKNEIVKCQFVKHCDKTNGETLSDVIKSLLENLAIEKTETIEQEYCNKVNQLFRYESKPIKNSSDEQAIQKLKDVLHEIEKSNKKLIKIESYKTTPSKIKLTDGIKDLITNIIVNSLYKDAVNTIVELDKKPSFKLTLEPKNITKIIEASICLDINGKSTVIRDVNNKAFEFKKKTFEKIAKKFISELNTHSRKEIDLISQLNSCKTTNDVLKMFD